MYIKKREGGGREGERKKGRGKRREGGREKGRKGGRTHWGLGDGSVGEGTCYQVLATSSFSPYL